MNCRHLLLQPELLIAVFDIIFNCSFVFTSICSSCNSGDYVFVLGNESRTQSGVLTLKTSSNRWLNSEWRASKCCLLSFDKFGNWLNSPPTKFRLYRRSFAKNAGMETFVFLNSPHRLGVVDLFH